MTYLFANTFDCHLSGKTMDNARMKKLDVKSLIDDLERYRKAAGLTKTRMSVLMGCNYPQQYITWTQRHTVPKDYIPRAMAILQMPTSAADVTLEIYDLVSRMTPDQQKKVLAILEEMSPPDA